MERFFEALDKCLELKIIKNNNRYCKEHGIDSRHIYTQRRDLGRGYFEIGWAIPLITQYGVSANWLLTGKGTMFVQ